jgi:hypothetical protein
MHSVLIATMFMTLVVGPAFTALSVFKDKEGL